MSREELLDEIWPHPSYHTGQKEIMLDCMEKLLDEGNDYYVVSAPTGFGKSPVCYTLSYAVGLLCDPSVADASEAARIVAESGPSDPVGYYVSPQNILLDQLQDDYGNLSPFGMVKGRAHYYCEESGKSCKEGKCRFDKQIECTGYEPERDAALESPVTNTNFSMFMVHQDIDRRGALVVDEAHMMPMYALDQVSVKLREDKLRNEGWDVPRFEEFAEYVEWMKPRSTELKKSLEKVEAELEQQAQFGTPDKDVVSRYERLKRLKGKMDRLIRDWRNVEEEWIIDHDDMWHEVKQVKLDTVEFRPITPYRFMDDLVFNKADKCVISSATPPKPKLIGLDPENVHVEEVESPFPIENRQCIVDATGKMGKSERAENCRRIAEKIESVAVGKTLIHAHTYDFRARLGKQLGSIVGEGNVMMQDQDNREGSLNKWIESDKQYFVSVNMYDGIDLKDDKCRTNIICVVPWPYMGDPQLQARMDKEGDEFVNWRTAMKIMQAYGRSTRSETDWSNTYILDSRFGWFFKKNSDMFYHWFAESVEYA